MSHAPLAVAAVLLVATPTEALADATNLGLDAGAGGVRDAKQFPAVALPKSISGNTRRRSSVGLSAQRWWQALLRDVVVAALSIFVPVLSALLFWLLRRIGLKVELERLDGLAERARNYAEHKADVWFKENGTKSSGPQKEDWAWELVETVDQKLKLKQKASQKLRALILAKVGELDANSEKRKLVTAAQPAPASAS